MILQGEFRYEIAVEWTHVAISEQHDYWKSCNEANYRLIQSVNQN